MLLPAMKAVSVSTSGVTAFKGLNHNQKINEYEFYDMKNMSSALLPVIASRGKRGSVRSFTKCNGLFAHEKLGWIDGTTLYYDGNAVGTVTDSEKTVLRMGANIIIWPDKVYYNTRTGEFGSLEAHYTSTGTVSAVLCRADGNVYSSYIISDTAPVSPFDGMYWLDTSGEKDVLKQYVDSKTMWVSIATVYVKISAVGIGTPFSIYDGIEMSGMDDDVLNGQFYIVEKADNWIVVTAILHSSITSNTAPVSISRKTPDMDYLTECNNRLWGCSSEKNEIYACALGDPKNWNQFIGSSTDSYAVNVGSPNSFTGAVTQLGNVLFFKEDIIHEVMGTQPSNFSIESLNIRGVANGSSKSICIVNETLYYKSTNDICSFYQSLPATISQTLGHEKYKNGVGGFLGNEYYLCMEDSAGIHQLFTYNVESQIWTKQDEIDIRWFANVANELYFVSENTLYSVNGNLNDYADDQATMEPSVNWMLETGDIGIDYPANKYISRAQLYMSAELGTLIKIELQTDASGIWKTIMEIESTDQRSITIPVTFGRCRTFKFRLSGTGEFKLWNLIWNVSKGSDVYAS